MQSLFIEIRRNRTNYTTAWEQREFSKFTFPAGEKNKNDLPLEPYAITNEHGFIAQSEAHDDFGYMQNVDRTMYIIVKPNSFAYNPARINVGSLGYYEGTENVIVSSLYEVFQTADYVDDVFLNYWFKTKNFMDWIAKLQEGSVRQYFYYDKLCECKMSMPSVAEQQQIGSYFCNLDNLITLHQRKYSFLFIRTFKFLKEACFFLKTNAWEQREFSKQYVKVSEKNDLSFGTDRIISVANMYFKEDTKESSDDYMRTYNVMRLGDIAFEGNKSKNFAHGRFVENTIGDGIVSHVFDVFRPIADYDLLFWKYIINNEGVMGRIMTRCTKASTMMTNLVADDFLKEKIAVPSLEEQRQIGLFLNGLDNLITLHQRKPFQRKNGGKNYVRRC